MPFMVPEVVDGEWFEVETSTGATEAVPADVVGRAPTVESFVPFVEDGKPLKFERVRKWGARTHSPGFLDSTEWSLFDEEKSAWAYLFSEHAASFRWTVIGDSVGITLPSSAAAEAACEAVQSVVGSRLERDGTFVYAMVGEDRAEEARDELEADGFCVTEEAA